jgi:hypothetical protein
LGGGCDCGAEAMKKAVIAASAELKASLAIERIGAVVDEHPIIVEPTMSKTDRFLGCAWPWGKQAVDNEVGEEARFGSALHEALALAAVNLPAISKINRIAKKFDVEADALVDRFKAAKLTLDAWMSGENPWGIDFRKWNLEVETALAYDIEADTARYCEGPNERHEYVDRRACEIPGTADIMGVGRGLKELNFSKKKPKLPPNTVLILDHKSGWDVGAPIESGQLKSLALAACKLHGARRAIIAFLHAPRDIAATVYADTIDEDGLEQHAMELRAANERRGNGSMRPGPWCKWCQVFSICPTNAPALLELRLKSTLTTAEDVGAAHQRLQEYRQRFANLYAIIDDEIRNWIKQNGTALRPDGDGVDLVERDYANLSQQSIIRALGRLKGGREIQRLKKLGAIETGTRKELRIVK